MKNITQTVSQMNYHKHMDLAPHVKDLITAYEAMPASPRRERIISQLQQTYLLATSDGLESLLSTKSTHHASSEKRQLKTAENASKYVERKYTVKSSDVPTTSRTYKIKLTKE